jgi:Tn3 transposase DDE domain
VKAGIVWAGRCSTENGANCGSVTGEGQEDQLGALGLVLNVIVLWNTIYMDAALSQLRAEGYSERDEDVVRLSPLIHEHINMLGRYSFVVPQSVVRGELRPLRTPADDEP